MNSLPARDLRPQVWHVASVPGDEPEPAVRQQRPEIRGEGVRDGRGFFPITPPKTFRDC